MEHTSHSLTNSLTHSLTHPIPPRGVTSTRYEESPDGSVRNRAARFLDDVARSLTPIVKHVCSFPKFGNKSKPERVLKRVLHRMSKQRTCETTVHGRPGSNRKLVFHKSAGNSQDDWTQSQSPPIPTRKSPPIPTLDVHTDEFLTEMGKSWREAFRNHDRPVADRILQTVLQAIPKSTRGT